MLQTFNFPAGGLNIRAAGRFFRYVSANNTGADETIKVRADGNDLGTYVPGEQIELPEPASRWEVVPLTPTTTGVVRVGMGRVTSDRLQGVVQVVDGERAKVLAGVAFSAVITVAGGGAGVPIAQIWNGGTTRNVFVQAVTIGSSANDTWNMSTITNVLNTAGANPGNSHDAGGGTSVAGPRQDNTGQALVGQRVYRIGYVAASTDRVVTLPRPILLRPNTGLIVALGALASNLRASFEYEEWPV